ncbi:MAG: 4-hydroxy-tetrahydrodipicolinate synthase [Chloroflexi bacterium]|nr:4-hydroxy-tetrahydrodipicolinate synthase [Chloroflexota bacterium]
MPAKLPWLRGVFPALVTPFTKDEEVDEAALRALVRHLLPHVDGFVPCGTTGEFPYMTPDEQKRVIAIVVDEVAGRKPIIAGTSAAGTKETILLARNAKEAGANACLVVTPFFLHPSDKGIYQHFYDVAMAVDIPIILYNIPQVVDAYLPRNVVEDLSDIPSIVGIKDSSGNLTYTMEILEMVQGRIDVFIGHDEVVLPALAGGCTGMILASANVYPEVWQKVYAAVQEGRIDEARALQRSVQKLSRIFCRYGGGLAVKQALNMMGIPVGKARRPLKVGGSLTHEDRAEIQLELERLGKIAPAEDPYAPPTGPVAERFGALDISAEQVRAESLRVGTGAAGAEPENAQIDLIAGPKDGIVGEVFALQLTYPRHGYEALTTILEPNLTVRPSTLIVPTAELKNLRQANMIYGPTQAAVARAIVDALEDGTIPQSAMDTHVMLVQASVHPKALDRHALYQAVLAAAGAAIRQAFGANR